MASCYSCGASLDDFLITKVSRQDSCSKCHRDIRCCRNCEFYDPQARWMCREEISEHVLEKEKSNFCDFFKLNPRGGAGSGGKSKDDILSAAEALFKKK